MREGWEYKKLGEVCEIERGGSPRPIQQYITNDEDGLNWIKIGDAVEGSKYINSTKEKIRKEGLKKTRFVHKGDFILSNSMSFGKPYILGIDGCIHDGWLVIRDTHNHFDKSFLYYLLGSPNMYNEFKRLAVGGVVNNLNSQLVRNVFVPVPPLSEQQRIVSELDLLSSIIEKKKAQLKEYDQLAQSIFYDMFGDPIENPKGWEVKELGEVCASMTKGPFGSDIKKSLFVPKSNDTYKVYIQANAIGKDISLGDYYISKDYFESKMFRFEVKPNDYIITCDGTLGKYIRLPHYIERGVISASLLRLTLNDIINHRYFEYLWDYYILQQQTKDIRNTALKHLPSATKMSKTPIPFPPLTLQQSFAEKMEAIEKQKELIKQSITETEILFNSRMDYYFN